MSDTPRRGRPPIPGRPPISRTPRVGCRSPQVVASHYGPTVQSVCWCEASMVWVTRDDVWNGLTISCGLDGCTPGGN
jgi:hypothetical protein